MDKITRLKGLDLHLSFGIEMDVNRGNVGDINARVNEYKKEAVNTLDGEELKQALHTAQVLEQVFRITLPALTENSSE